MLYGTLESVMQRARHLDRNRLERISEDMVIVCFRDFTGRFMCYMVLTAGHSCMEPTARCPIRGGETHLEMRFVVTGLLPIRDQ